MPRSVLLAIAGGCLSATVLVVALSGPFGGAILAYFTPLPLLCAGLALGAGLVPVALAAGLAWTTLFGSIAVAGVFGGVHALPSWIVVYQALTRRPAASAGADPEWMPAGSVLASLTLLAATAAAGAGLLAAGGEGIEAAVRTMLDATLGEALPMLPVDDRGRLAAGIAPVFIGACGATWVVMLVVNTVLAQGLLAARGWNIRPTPQWSALTLPDWTSWSLVAAAAIALVAGGDLGYLARNLVLVFAVPFFFLGLAVVHRLGRRLPNGGLMLAVFYIALALVFAAIAGIVTAIGIIEQWFGLRRRLTGGGEKENT